MKERKKTIPHPLCIFEEDYPTSVRGERKRARSVPTVQTVFKKTILHLLCIFADVG